MANAQHMNDLRSELSLEISDNLREMMKRLKVCFNLNHEITKDQKREIAVVYISTKETIQTYDQALSDFK